MRIKFAVHVDGDNYCCLYIEQHIISSVIYTDEPDRLRMELT